MVREGDRCARELSDARVDALVYACLIAIMARGAGAHEEAEARLAEVAAENGSPTPVVSSAGALVRALHTLGRSGWRSSPRIWGADPARGALSGRVRHRGRRRDQPRGHRQRRRRPAGPGSWWRWRAGSTERADAIVSACVQMPSLPVIAAQRELGIPVLSAATATVFELLGSAWNRVVPDAGSLLASRERRPRSPETEPSMERSQLRQANQATGLPLLDAPGRGYDARVRRPYGSTALAWVEPYYDSPHLRATVLWLVRLDPAAPEPMLVAALTHDMERHFPGGTQPNKAAGAWDDVEYNTRHMRRSAEIVSDWLRSRACPRSSSRRPGPDPPARVRGLARGQPDAGRRLAVVPRCQRAAGRAVGPRRRDVARARAAQARVDVRANPAAAGAGAGAPVYQRALRTLPVRSSSAASP